MMASPTFLNLPEKSASEQKESKTAWNRQHCPFGEADFYTIGYQGRKIDEFISALTKAGVVTLVDVRFSPVSRYKPDFSKSNLREKLASNFISYIHKPDWGVPRDIRAFSIGKDNREAIWDWYDVNVLPNVAKKNVDEFFNSMEHPVAFMCMEYDPTECHRHRITLGLEKLGLVGCDL
jgi:uncharacterized protein (DUF488 family)